MSEFALQLKAVLGRVVVGSGLLAGLAGAVAASDPLRLDPENPHYFRFRGAPTIVITSGEHYGAVLNEDFEFYRYLNTLAREGMNGTRLWVGAYCEPEDAFNIAHNTLAPLPERLRCPWPRSASPGYANGGNKFDLDRWDPVYFQRLHDFVAQASRRGIIVEVNLFCPFYEEKMWRLSPMNPANNTSGIAPVARTNVYTLDKSGRLLAVQEALVRKVVTELNAFDNVYFEICNEPYFGGVTLAWQRHIADVLVETENKLGRHHLISQNIANQKAVVRNPHPGVSIFNFHYASPPDTVALNYGLNQVIGDNETGFRGTNDAPYRMEAWDFIIAGGGLFNHLDYSFTAGHEDGTFVFPASQPGGGGHPLRHQLRFLSEFMQRFDFLHMMPATEVITAGVPPEMTARVLAKPGADYLIYLRPDPRRRVTAAQPIFAKGQLALSLALPTGQYVAEWYDPRLGTLAGRAVFTQTGGDRRVAGPAFEGDVLLAVRRLGEIPAVPRLVEVTTNEVYHGAAPETANPPPARPAVQPVSPVAIPQRAAAPAEGVARAAVVELPFQRIPGAQTYQPRAETPPAPGTFIPRHEVIVTTNFLRHATGPAEPHH